MADKCYIQYLISSECNIYGNPKYFWNYINYKQSSSALPNNFSYSADCPLTTQRKLLIFCGLFFICIHWLWRCIYAEFTLTRCILSENFNWTEAINISKSKSPDGVLPVILKQCQFTRPLSLLFRMLLSSGTFQSLWKKSFIVPIYKSRDSTNVVNYIPILRISCIPKIF